MKTYTAEEIAQAQAEVKRHYRAIERAWQVVNGIETVAAEQVAVAQLQAAVQAFAAWLAQDTRPATAPSWAMVGAETDDGRIIGPLDNLAPDIQTVY